MLRSFMAGNLTRGVARIAVLLGFVLPAALARAAPPSPERPLPEGPRGVAVQEGRRIVSDTARALPDSVGNGLVCTNCHLKGGTASRASPWTGIWGVFPEYRARNGKLITLEERINDCMERSMNGRPLAYDSEAMVAILAYIQWLSEGTATGTSPPGRGFGTIDEKLIPRPERGPVVYAEHCASCHQAQGEGLQGSDGRYAVPPLWGPRSFNVGAGMARTYTAAAFILHNMPLGQPDSLSAQDAVDVAQFITHGSRPAFPRAKEDWPHGGRPVDARID